MLIFTVNFYYLLKCAPVDVVFLYSLDVNCLHVLFDLICKVSSSRIILLCYSINHSLSVFHTKALGGRVKIFERRKGAKARKSRQKGRERG